MRKKLKSEKLHNNRDHDAMVQARFTQYNKMDSSASFFFSQETNVGEKKSLTHVKLLTGQETTDKF